MGKFSDGLLEWPELDRDRRELDEAASSNVASAGASPGSLDPSRRNPLTPTGFNVSSLLQRVSGLELAGSKPLRSLVPWRPSEMRVNVVHNLTENAVKFV
jgi:hypothetical protein